MTREDFQTFLNSLVRTYPEVSRHFAKGDSQELSDIWQRAMSRIPLEDSLDAIDAMFRGDLAKPEYGWSDLPKIVIGYCRGQANLKLERDREQYEDGRRVHCKYCGDNKAGVVLVWNPWFVRNVGSNIMLCDSAPDARSLFRSWKSRNRGMGGMSITVLCCCNSPVASARRARLEQWKTNDKQKRPACINVFKEGTFTQWLTGHPRELRGEELPPLEMNEFLRTMKKSGIFSSFFERMETQCET